MIKGILNELDSIGRYVVTLAEKPIATMAGGLAAAALWFNGLERVWQLVLFLFSCMVFDAVTGVAAAKKRGEVVSSIAARRTFEKLIGYGGVIYITFIILRVCEAPGVIHGPTMNGVVGAVIGVECLSVLENIDKLEIKRLSSVIRPVAKFCNWPVKAFKDSVAKEDS